jgi:hypothetical protein
MNILNLFKPESPDRINARVLANAKSQLAQALAEREAIEAHINQCQAAIARLTPKEESK